MARFFLTGLIPLTAGDTFICRVDLLFYLFGFTVHFNLPAIASFGQGRGYGLGMIAFCPLDIEQIRLKVTIQYSGEK